MAYRIKAKKVNRKFLYATIKAQQAQLNAVYEQLSHGRHAMLKDTAGQAGKAGHAGQHANHGTTGQSLIVPGEHL